MHPRKGITISLHLIIAAYLIIIFLERGFVAIPLNFTQVSFCVRMARARARVCVCVIFNIVFFLFIFHYRDNGMRSWKLLKKI